MPQIYNEYDTNLITMGVDPAIPPNQQAIFLDFNRTVVFNVSNAPVSDIDEVWLEEDPSSGRSPLWAESCTTIRGFEGEPFKLRCILSRELPPKGILINAKVKAYNYVSPLTAIGRIGGGEIPAAGMKVVPASFAILFVALSLLLFVF
jgi:hypothetical protein